MTAVYHDRKGWWHKMSPHLSPKNNVHPHTSATVHHKHAVPYPHTSGCVGNDPEMSVKNTLHRPLSLEGGLLRNSTPDSHRLPATVAVSLFTPVTLHAPLLGGSSCDDVVGVSKTAAQFVAVDVPLRFRGAPSPESSREGFAAVLRTCGGGVWRRSSCQRGA